MRSYVLLRLDAALSAGGATYDYPVISVEHVLPQSPAANSQWLTHFPYADERQRLTHKLGNLLLLTRRKNSAVQNHDFSVKKQSYFAGGSVTSFNITTQVFQEPVWTPAIVLKRQQEAINKLRAVWDL